MRVYELRVEMKRCTIVCPNFENKDGMGHCNDWIWCRAAGREIISFLVPFPEFCPLKEVKDG
jgi:hypothetical protein